MSDNASSPYDSPVGSLLSLKGGEVYRVVLQDGTSCRAQYDGFVNPSNRTANHEDEALVIFEPIGPGDNTQVLSAAWNKVKAYKLPESLSGTSQHGTPEGE